MSHLGGVVDRALDTLVLPGFTNLGMRLRSRLADWPADASKDSLAGRHVAITGATSGLGLATAHMASDLGAHVHLIVRNTDLGHEVADSLAGPATVWECDVSDLESVRRCAQALVASRVVLHALVHNAGAMPAVRTESRQGHEMTMALHVLGPVLLTEAALPALAGAHVVFVTSGGMYLQRLHVDDLEYRQGTYAGATAYARSKRAQVELLAPLQERWAPQGITVSATHPGWAATPGVTQSLPTFDRFLKPLLRSAEEGADTTVWLIAMPGRRPGGLLWHDRHPRPTSRGAVPQATPQERARLLGWVLSAIES